MIVLNFLQMDEMWVQERFAVRVTPRYLNEYSQVVSNLLRCNASAICLKELQVHYVVIIIASLQI